MSTALETCHAHFDGERLTMANALVERRWRLVDSALVAESFLDKRSGREWFAGASPAASLTLPAGFQAPAGNWTCDARQDGGLEVELRCGEVAYRFKMFADACGVSMRLSAPQRSPAAVDEDAANTDAVECFPVALMHARLLQVTLHDGTDVRDNLIFENEWQPHPAEEIRACGNVFCIEDRLSGDGLVMLKQAPLPHARPNKCDVDLEWKGGAVRLLGHGLGDGRCEGYECVTLAYRGGRVGRIAALQQYQRAVRPIDLARDGLFMCNTWGDRSKDGRICETFMLREIEAAARLGVEVVQIDDGWQRGASGNSIVSGGVWTGFWERDEGFWEPHPQRFPNGLHPIAAAGERYGVKIGLWYAPDSSGDFQNWRRDADQVLSLYRQLGIRHFKIDGVKMFAGAGERNLHCFLDAARVESDDAITFDLDVTAGVRPGYFGAMRAGGVFVENRYTDWHNYWPHTTLRNFWQLAQYVDPLRLRMEFLNNARNAELYGDDPLAPARYRADYLFASVMFASPLGWFEASALSDRFVEEVAPLIKVWKAHRRRMSACRVTSIGDTPDGTGWTGFAAREAEGGGYLLIFRELNEVGSHTIELPMFSSAAYETNLLAGEGRVEISRSEARVDIPRALRFLFARVGARS